MLAPDFNESRHNLIRGDHLRRTVEVPDRNGGRKLRQLAERAPTFGIGLKPEAQSPQVRESLDTLHALEEYLSWQFRRIESAAQPVP